jgi:hypothetical protein
VIHGVAALIERHLLGIDAIGLSRLPRWRRDPR